jgi:hypothetical protein
MRHALSLSIAALAVTGAAGLALAQGDEAGRPVTVQMTGAAERPGPGDPDGSGTAVFRLNPGQERVCFEISVQDILLPTIGAHIHRADVNSPGPIVIGLTPPDADGTSEGCVQADRQLIRDILTNPSAFYVNVHTTDFPAGAVRAQLGRRPR